MAEHEELTDRITGYKHLLANETLLHGVMKDELRDIANRYGDDRRTEILPGGEFEIEDEDLIEEEQVVIAMTRAGYIKRMPVDVYEIQHRGGRGITAMQTREDDVVDTILTTSTHQNLIFFTNFGKCYRLKGYQIPEASRQARGIAIVNLLHLDPDERVRTFLRADTPKDGDYLVIATRRGMVKKTALSEYSNIYRSGLIAINLREDDRLTNVRIADDHHDIILVTRNGMSIRFPESSIRPTGRNTMGVRGIRLDDDDEVIGMVTTDHDDSLLVVTEKGYGKRSRLEDYRPQNRAGKGLITYKVTKKTGRLVGAAQVNDESEILLINDQGIIIRIPAGEIPIQGRNTSGVTLMRSRDGKVVDMSIVIDEEDEIKHEEIRDTESDIEDADPSAHEYDRSEFEDAEPSDEDDEL